MSLTLVAIMPLIDKFLAFIPNPKERAKAQQELTLKLVQIESEQMLAQVQINQVEAQHASLFVAGWRPFIGWVGGVALAYTFVVYPLAVFIAALCGFTEEIPKLETSELMSLVTAMLGIGAMRSYDKFKGVDTKGITRPTKKPTLNN
jgi:hypothetical protein